MVINLKKKVFGRYMILQVRANKNWEDIKAKKRHTAHHDNMQRKILTPYWVEDKILIPNIKFDLISKLLNLN